MKIAFAGTPEFAVPVLEALVTNGYNVVAAITQTDKPVGRKGILTPSPVAVCAQNHGIPVYKFPKIKDSVSEVEGIGADVLFTCAYGQILSKQVLDIFPLGVWNAHASLLPKFRGASPIQSAILAGEQYTGVTIMRTELSLDSGDMLLVKRTKVEEGETCGELSLRLSHLAAEAVVEAAGLIEKGDVATIIQNDVLATYCGKITKADAKADFTRAAKEVAQLINAMNPSPVAHAMLKGAPVNIYRASECTFDGGKEAACGEVVSLTKGGIIVKCGGGSFVNIKEMQFTGGKKLTAADILNGRKLAAGDKFD